MKRFRDLIAVIAICMMAFTLLPFNVEAAQVESTMTLATTTSTQDSGLLDYLLPVFEKDYNTKVKVIAVGSGQAMEMGKKGDADVLLVHSRAAEDKFVADGFGINRKDVMHNEFLIVGPASDPAKIKGTTDVVAGFKKIAASESKFVSRGDKSGTHVKEQGIWKKADIIPALPWYIEAGKGMGDTLLMSGEMKAYTLADEATWLSWKGKTELTEILQGDKLLFNPYGVIAVNPAKHPGVHKNAANAFIEFMTGSKGQNMIASFGKEKHGKALFTADALPAPAAPAPAAPAPAAPAPAAPAPAAVSPAEQATVNVYALNVRTGPGTNYRVLGSVIRGTQLQVLGSSGKWLKVKYNNNEAYVAGWLVKK
ncbi:MAG: substrate-binding domain-containing protein [Syntrophomonas sp.]|uniref:substrate-binding domain-containing protein n=1 Tax=Syntrophomonas sp. TaxID=2053627 RepID=UPI00262B0251|nr:substrate-binding domain-containing protein [Syntrophomonas sp.]MDD2510184.1 substrate-binding domain-containing protein [Syntrophomonas sp.]MDD3879164.1 substrate-binding domain-containing protein [Syntrophomonas sp.]MDD4625791.1 substrate-binding domain-containing protein [Syntrophomonas sp.]